jgi:hypothetical protein
MGGKKWRGEEGERGYFKIDLLSNIGLRVEEVQMENENSRVFVALEESLQY